MPTYPMNPSNPFATTADPTLDAMIRAVEAYRAYCSNQSLFPFEAFLWVAARGPISPSEIIRGMRIPQPVLSGALGILDTGGRGVDPMAPNLVTRIGHPEDSRRTLAALTPRGTRAASAMRVALGLKR